MLKTNCVHKRERERERENVSMSNRRRLISLTRNKGITNNKSLKV